MWLLVPAIGLAELVAQYSFSDRAPSPSEWQQLASVVGARATEMGVRLGDFGEGETPIIVAPGWAEPSARQALDADLLPLRHLARPDERGFQSVLEISATGHEAPALLGWPVSAERRAGEFVLRLRKNPNWSEPKYRFVEHVYPPDLFVSLKGPSREVRCSWTEEAAREAGGLSGVPAFPTRRFRCPGSSRFFVGVTVIDGSEAFRPHRCIWAHPGRSGPVQLRFREVPAGEVIRGYGMIPWLLEREQEGLPVELKVRVDGEVAGTYMHSDGEGWRPFAFALPPPGPNAAGRTEGRRETVDVEFEVSAPPSKERYFCFYAEMN
jgi:hypothetical protein